MYMYKIKKNKLKNCESDKKKKKVRCVYQFTNHH